MKRGILTWLAIVTLGLLIGSAAQSMEVEALIEYSHVSDITRGKPFNKQDEWQVDYIGFGATLRIGARKRFELDLSHGRKSLEHGAWEPGTKLGLRFYPGRKR